MTKRQCAEPGDNHSKDLLTVFDGHPEPTILCGFHEQVRHFAAEARNRQVQAEIAAAQVEHPCPRCGGPTLRWREGQPDGDVISAGMCLDETCDWQY